MGLHRATHGGRATTIRPVLKTCGPKSPEQSEPAFNAIPEGRVDERFVRCDALFSFANPRSVLRSAPQRRMTVVGNSGVAAADGTDGSGRSGADLNRHVALFVDRALKGARTGDAPIERAIGFGLLLNAKQLRQLGSKEPDVLRARVPERWGQPKS